MSRFERILLYIVATGLIALVVYTATKGRSGNKEVFVDIGKLLENYKFRKELQQAASMNINKIKRAADSLQMVKKVTGSAAVDSQLVRANNALAQYYELSSKDATKKIWDRLNPAITEFGKQRKYELIIGANGAGTILYGSSDRDVTDELIKYVNENYEKGN